MFDSEPQKGGDEPTAATLRSLRHNDGKNEIQNNSTLYSQHCSCTLLSLLPMILAIETNKY